jgi:transcriptional regulator with XRE-family HTH domain
MNDFDLIPEHAPGRRLAETLARKFDLLLDTILAENGKTFDYPAVRDPAQAQGFYVSREQWDLLKAGKEQTLTEELLRALAGVFGVSPEYLLEEDGPLSERVEAELILLRSMRRAGVRNFHACQSAQVGAATLREIARILDELD